jgi:hypothetical protein
MGADTGAAQDALDALDALGQSVRATAGRHVRPSEDVVRRGRRSRRRRHAATALTAVLAVLIGVVAWRTVPAGDAGGLRYGGAGRWRRP